MSDEPANTAAGRPTTSRVTLLRRISDWLMPKPSGECQLWSETNHPTLVPAQGSAFDFLVYSSMRWTGVGISRAELEYQIRVHMSTAASRVRWYAAAIGRRHPPHHIQDFEVELNAKLDRHTPLRFTDEETEVFCAIRVRVEADERIRQSLQPSWERRVVLESEHDLDMQRAHLVQQRTEAWTTLIEKLQHSPVAGSAAALAEEEFSKVYAKMLDERDKMAGTLAEVLRDIVRNNRQIGAYELAESYDRLLRSYEMRSGLTVTPPGHADTSGLA
jgi:hypothetical protein